jgi:hypothetical protein
VLQGAENLAAQQEADLKLRPDKRLSDEVEMLSVTKKAKIFTFSWIFRPKIVKRVGSTALS